MQPVTEWFQNLAKAPFYVQFVRKVRVEGCSDVVTEVRSFLIAAESKAHAGKLATDMIDPLNEAYRNRDGQVVTMECLGVHSIDEIDSFGDDSAVDLGGVFFTQSTRLEHLLLNFEARDDLPLLNQ